MTSHSCQDRFKNTKKTRITQSCADELSEASNCLQNVIFGKPYLNYIYYNVLLPVFHMALPVLPKRGRQVLDHPVNFLSNGGNSQVLGTTQNLLEYRVALTTRG